MESENCPSSKVNTPSGSQNNDILKLEVGMTFNLFEEGEMFYKKYAKEMGFVVRRHTMRLDKKNDSCCKNEWADVISKNNLKDIKWSNVIYKIRESWIPAYAMDQNIFTVGIWTTQLAESMNAFIDKFENKNTLM
ncbi:hypothetical protein CFOL_v3_27235 [Cephalotus follicularis]|uniref:Protein FAR1-RELATED SEQUENCE n=1 Tax=Cephalotus follicularis TaxID=3775 RepID=A0A1Q3CU95_CEPFO|nr:hypothetical protein CFOL_v3_27235 [Cephalotus follicularis]